VYDPFTLGGFLKLSGYRFEQRSGQKYSFGDLVYTYRVGSLPSPLGRGVYLGGSLETGSVSSQFDVKAQDGWLFGSSIFLGADTAIGPFFAGFGLAGDKSTAFYVLLGTPWSSGR
jgi:NTE family protein